MKTAPSEVRVLAYRHLIDDKLWGRITTRIVKALEFQQHFGDQSPTVQCDWSKRILNETLGFLQLCARNDFRQAYSPSTLVDIGWHTFILYTREYFAFCIDLTGKYIHHAPSDIDGYDYGTPNVGQTAAALRTLGPVDDALWQSAAGTCDAECKGCCSGCGPKHS